MTDWTAGVRAARRWKAAELLVRQQMVQEGVLSPEPRPRPDEATQVLRTTSEEARHGA